MSDGTFTLDISRFVAKVKARQDEVVRRIAIELLRRIVLRSPVGNAELWAVNAHAAQYNTEVANHNAALSLDPANLDRRGHLKPGRKLNDGMGIKAPAGYTGGRFRANWFVAIGSPNESTIAAVDPSGNATIAAGLAVLTAVKTGQPIFITNSLPYAHKLEFEGHSKQAPAGMLRVTIAELQIIVDEAVRNLPND
jgi:hypothetical protein